MKIFASAVALFLGLGAMSPGCDAVDFDYAQYGADWPDLAMENNECGAEPTATSGNSPINITSTPCDASLPGIQLNDGTCTLSDLTWTLSPGGVKVSYPASGCTPPYMTMPEIPGEVYTAAQYHIHVGCEHLVDGKGCDLELHIVHLNANATDAAVLGFMMDNNGEAGDTEISHMVKCWSAEMNKYIENCNNELCKSRGSARKLVLTDEACPTSGLHHPYKLIPDGAGYYQYRGGLTTPPCSQIVNWNLVDKKVPISLKDWAQLTWLISEYKGHVDAQNNCVPGSPIAHATGSTSRETRAIGPRTVNHKCVVKAN